MSSHCTVSVEVPSVAGSVARTGMSSVRARDTTRAPSPSGGRLDLPGVVLLAGALVSLLLLLFGWSQTRVRNPLWTSAHCAGNRS